MTKTVLLLTALLSAISSVFARGDEDSLQQILPDDLKRADSIEKTLHYKTGKIELGSGIASINVPAGFKFLEPAEAKYVVENLWGNPSSTNPPLGVLFPANSGATDPGSYAFVIQFEDMGYVKDDDADDINYDDLLKDMKEGSAERNKARKEAGLLTMDVVGWAAKPYYDKERKVLHWAKELSVEGTDVNTLNYDVRVLGRKGVLTLKAVSSMDQLDSVNSHINDVLAMVSFNEGHKYANFDSNTDEIAALTVGGLVAGKVLAKAGFFAVIMKSLKFILIGLALVGGAIWRFITGRKKKEEEFVYQPQTAQAPDNNDQTNSPA